MIDATAVLPARLNSSRIPEKLLADLGGRPLLWHAWQQVINAKLFRAVFVASDSPIICELVNSWGANAILTDGDFLNGTDRIASIMGRLGTTHFVNVQADMPRIDPGLFGSLLTHWEACGTEVVTPVYRLTSVRELMDPNVVKAVLLEDGNAIMFSRLPVPYLRDEPIEKWPQKECHWGHVGIYGVTASALERYSARSPSSLERSESLEQLRFLELGIPIATFVTSTIPWRIDSPEDLAGIRSRFTGAKVDCGKGDS